MKNELDNIGTMAEEYAKASGTIEGWISDKEKQKKEDEEKRRKQEEQEAKEKREKEIMESTDPEMDDMGTIFIHGFGHGSRTERMTRREAMLNGFDKASGPVEAWVSDKEKQEKEDEEKRRKQEEQEAKEKREKEIMESTDPEMDDIGTMKWRGHPRVDFGGCETYSIQITKREALLIQEGFLDKYEVLKKQNEEKTKNMREIQESENSRENEEPIEQVNTSQDKGKITFESIKQAINKVLGRGER